MLTAAQRPLAMLIRYAVHFVDPEAEVYIRRSVVQDTADWEIAVVPKRTSSITYWREIIDALYEVELATEQILLARVLDASQVGHKFHWVEHL